MAGRGAVDVRLVVQDPCGHVKRDPQVSVNLSVDDLLR